MSRTEQKAKTKENITAAAGRSFRCFGFNGVGVDGLAKEAGVTSGAFYVHFSSKTEAFYLAIIRGMEELRKGIENCQNSTSEDWWQDFVNFYVTQKRACNLSEACALQALLGEISRADDTARQLFTKELDLTCEQILKGPETSTRPTNLSQVYVCLVLLSGGVTLARALNDEVKSGEVADAIHQQLIGKRI